MNMTLNNLDLFFHLANHYKKIKQAKTVIDCSAPTGYQKIQVKQSSDNKKSRPSVTPRKHNNASSHYPSHSTGIKKHDCLAEVSNHGRSTSVPTRRVTSKSGKKKEVGRARSMEPTYNYRKGDEGERSSSPEESGEGRKCVNGCKKKDLCAEASYCVGSRMAKTTLSKTEKSNTIVKQPSVMANKNQSSNVVPITDKGVKSPSSTTGYCPDDHEYLHFLLRVTEDILLNNAYGDDDIDEIFQSHIEANKNRLDMDKMLEYIYNFKKEINFPRNYNETVDRTTSADRNCTLSADQLKILESMLCCQCRSVQTTPAISKINNVDVVDPIVDMVIDRIATKSKTLQTVSPILNRADVKSVIVAPIIDLFDTQQVAGVHKEKVENVIVPIVDFILERTSTSENSKSVMDGRVKSVVTDIIETQRKASDHGNLNWDEIEQAILQILEKLGSDFSILKSDIEQIIIKPITDYMYSSKQMPTTDADAIVNCITNLILDGFYKIQPIDIDKAAIQVDCVQPAVDLIKENLEERKCHDCNIINISKMDVQHTIIAVVDLIVDKVLIKTKSIKPNDERRDADDELSRPINTCIAECKGKDDNIVNPIIDVIMDSVVLDANISQNSVAHPVIQSYVDNLSQQDEESSTDMQTLSKIEKDSLDSLKGDDKNNVNPDDLIVSKDDCGMMCASHQPPTPEEQSKPLREAHNSSMGKAQAYTHGMQKLVLKIQLEDESKEDDYVLVDGPVFIPKTLLGNKQAIPILLQTSPSNKIEKKSSQQSIGSIVNGAKRHEVYRSISNYANMNSHNNKLLSDEYDITPQKEKSKIKSSFRRIQEKYSEDSNITSSSKSTVVSSIDEDNEKHLNIIVPGTDVPAVDQSTKSSIHLHTSPDNEPSQLYESKVVVSIDSQGQISETDKDKQYLTTKEITINDDLDYDKPPSLDAREESNLRSEQPILGAKSVLKMKSSIIISKQSDILTEDLQENIGETHEPGLDKYVNSEMLMETESKTYSSSSQIYSVERKKSIRKAQHEPRKSTVKTSSQDLSEVFSAPQIKPDFIINERNLHSIPSQSADPTIDNEPKKYYFDRNGNITSNNELLSSSNESGVRVQQKKKLCSCLAKKKKIRGSI